MCFRRFLRLHRNPHAVYFQVTEFDNLGVLCYARDSSKLEACAVSYFPIFPFILNLKRKKRGQKGTSGVRLAWRSGPKLRWGEGGHLNLTAEVRTFV